MDQSPAVWKCGVGKPDTIRPDASPGQCGAGVDKSWGHTALIRTVARGNLTFHETSSRSDQGGTASFETGWSSGPVWLGKKRLVAEFRDGYA
jgi:hypothetical protein